MGSDDLNSFLRLYFGPEYSAGHFMTDDTRRVGPRVSCALLIDIQSGTTAGMRPRRHSVDSETSSDSWSVIQKNVELHEHSDDEIEFEPSESEQWDSDSDQETHDGGKSGDEGNDSLEECDESQVADDDAGDCEIVEEDEAMEVNGCRYYVPSEKICKALDLLDAECCSSFEALLRWVIPSTRDATRALVLLFFAVSTAILFANSSRLGDMDGDRSAEVFASGLQSREDFGRVFTPSLRRRSRFNFSETCNRWQVSVWSATPSWPAKEPATAPPLFFPSMINSTPKFEINEGAFFSRPAMKISPISISHYAKPHDVCRQEDVRRGRRPATASISGEIDVDPWIARPYLLSAPVSISRMAQPRRDVCSQQVRREKAAPFPGTGRAQQKKSFKMLTGRHQPRIAHRKQPSAIKKDLKFVLPRPPPKRPCFLKKRVSGPCFPVCLPCLEKNTTTKRYKGPKSILARPTNRQLSVYKKRPPVPSIPRLHRPCVNHHDAVKCWKSFGQRPEPKQKHRGAQTHLDWFTRRAQIRAEHRRN